METTYSFSLTDVPEKTPQGVQALQDAGAVSGQLRRLLLMVDGQKNVQRLLSFGEITGDRDNFVALLEAGYIHFASATPEKAPSKPTVPVPSESLQEAVTRVFRQLYGEGFVKEVEKIARNFPPQSQPNKFVDACKTKAAMLLSPAEIEQAFAEIHNRWGY